METPLTPLEFARRTRKLYPERVAVIDGDSSWTYAQFFDRCDRWSAVLQQLRIGSGDRVAYLAPNTHAQLESFYAVPQVASVLVPLNYRLTADDFVYLSIIAARAWFAQTAIILAQSTAFAPAFQTWNTSSP